MLPSCMHTHQHWGEWDTHFVGGFMCAEGMMRSIPGPENEQPAAFSPSNLHPPICTPRIPGLSCPVTGNPSPCAASQFNFFSLCFWTAACFLLLVFILASVLPSHEAVSHKATPLCPSPQLPVLSCVSFSPSRDDRLSSTLLNHWHLISGFVSPLSCSPSSCA